MLVTSSPMISPHSTVHNMCLHASDFFPTYKEARSMRCSLDEQEKSIQNLDIQIASLEALVTELLARRAVLIQSSTIQKALLSPVRKLAPEILGDIFEYCMPDEDDPNPISEESGPLLLSRVCKRWRRVASGTPRLWTSVYCGLPCKVNPLVIITTWLRNSGSLPFDVSFGSGLDKLYRSKTHGEAFKSCLRILNANFHRCKSFRGINFDVLSTLFPIDHRTNAPLLRELRLIPSTTTEGPVVIGEIAAPNLGTMDICQPLSLDSITMNHTCLQTLRWDASVAFGYRQASPRTLPEIIASYANMEECALQLPAKQLDASIADATISLSKLRRLSLGFPMTADPSDLLNAIDAPALEYLSLEQTSSITRGPDISRALRSLVSTTSPSLREIHLTRMIFSGQDVFAAQFAPLSNLVSLNFHHCFIHPAFLAGLTPNPESSPDTWTLPKLSSLCFHETGVLVEDLIRMIECRLVVGPSSKPTLTSVSMLNCRIPSYGHEALRKLAKNHAGLQLTITDDH